MQFALGFYFGLWFLSTRTMSSLVLLLVPLPASYILLTKLAEFKYKHNLNISCTDDFNYLYKQGQILDRGKGQLETIFYLMLEQDLPKIGDGDGRIGKIEKELRKLNGWKSNETTATNTQTN